ncbi:MAG: hypothetical protein HY749_15925 [Gammaproteobacteria bacterium]|nr:hypothetical protein [Gammaproteobacteria bacterium]
MKHDEKWTAYHEAGHAAADLILGHYSMGVSIVAKPEDGSRGRAVADGLDEFSTAGVANIVVALLAGAEAQRRVMRPCKRSAAWIRRGGGDNRQIQRHERILRVRGRDPIPALRERTRALLSEHWDFVEMIAEALLEHRVLHGDEVNLLHDIYRGDAEARDLTVMRVHVQDTLRSMPGRRDPLTVEVDGGRVIVMGSVNERLRARLLEAEPGTKLHAADLRADVDDV